ncbi:hypothetical protein NQZ68_013319 [Dissostichus eleginoides]|nr:hypothetical protein NQZ68_013319 [Dissostichus eleginoides]
MDRHFDVRPGPVGTLMSVCGRVVEVELPSNGDEKPSPFNCEGPPRDWQARGLRKDCSCPSLFPTSSVTAKADMTALSSMEKPVR